MQKYNIFLNQHVFCEKILVFLIDYFYKTLLYLQDELILKTLFQLFFCYCPAKFSIHCDLFRVFFELLLTKTAGFADTDEKRRFFYRDENFIISRIEVSVYRDKKNYISR